MPRQREICKNNVILMARWQLENEEIKFWDPHSQSYHLEFLLHGRFAFYRYLLHRKAWRLDCPPMWPSTAQSWASPARTESQRSLLQSWFPLVFCSHSGPLTKIQLLPVSVLSSCPMHIPHIPLALIGQSLPSDCSEASSKINLTEIYQDSSLYSWLYFIGILMNLLLLKSHSARLGEMCHVKLLG